MSQEPVKRTATEERESYLEGYRRDLAAWEARLEAIADEGLEDEDRARATVHAKRGIENAKAGIRQYGGQLEQAETRPAGRAKTTR